MNTLKLTNTLTRSKDEFTPINQGKVSLYCCGPTVYQIPTIGNFRAFIFDDVLRRVLEMNGYEVRMVMNITDVGHLTDDADAGEDKMIVAMKKEGKSAWEIAEAYTKIFLEHMKKLNILDPHVMPRATDHIPQQIALIQDLEKNGYAYKTSDGVYFDTTKLEGYGKLDGQKQDEKQEGSRVAINSEKRSPSDFALWKLSPQDTKRDMEWESPWGTGFPGWHIECSAMSEEYLDTPFDIHTGGIDHIPVHHPNEMAQTEGARGHELSKWWLHNDFIQVNGGKMSKSLGNAFTINDVEEHGYGPIAYRYFCLTAHYRSPLNFTWEALEAASNALHNLQGVIWNLGADIGALSEPDIEKFTSALNDDLNTASALAALWDLTKDQSLSKPDKLATILEMDKVLGLNLKASIAEEKSIPEEIKKLLNNRQNAREAKDWEATDRIRDEIKAAGYIVEDTPGGQKVRPIR